MPGKNATTGGHDARSLSLRTLDVLGAFGAARPRLTLSELSRASGLSLTTTHRIVADLLEWGALEEADGGYQVGLRLWEAACAAPRGLALRETALPAMEDLYEATHENVQLAVREGLEVVYVERITGRGAVRVLTKVGGRFALPATGVGLVLLAHAPREVQERVLAEPLRRWTPYTVTDPAVLRKMLADVRCAGTARSDRQVTEDAFSVACPVRGVGGEVVAALSVVVRSDGPLTPKALTPAVQAAGRSISRALGWEPARPAGGGRLLGAG
ncbi:IclR family transcriptional regulator [Streptomyces samsunensis]|uniref:IclR family transcriptional regulator n=1 Tax=Streptomyces malaysiensis TaxID=92644 RepID=UPI0015821BE2|nr:IclR family transcriptional regulator [Streptomyces samsunensis]NUH36423.1 IclR family transcriptional regulator [Streptomyces samsunensis]